MLIVKHYEEWRYTSKMSGAKLAPPLHARISGWQIAELHALPSDENGNFGASLQYDYKYEH